MVVALATAAVVASSTSRRTNHHRRGTMSRGSCRPVSFQLLSNSECNHRPLCPRNSLGNLCNCLCNRIHTLVRRSCRSLLGTPPLALPTLVLTVPSTANGLCLMLTAESDQLLAVANFLEVAQRSNKPDSPNHHPQSKHNLSSCMVALQGTPSNNLRRCHPCAPRNNLDSCGKCQCHCSTLHKPGCHIGPLVVVCHQ